MNKFKAGIYKIEHIASGKLYVGSAVHIGRRWIVHVRNLRAKTHHSIKMQRAWNKYGADAFAFSILENVDDLDRLLEMEQKWLDLTRSAVRGYNMTPSAGSLYDFRQSDVTKERMRQAAIGHVKSDEHRKNLSVVNTGKKMSDESRQKMRDAKLGKKRKPHSPETKAKMSAKALGRTFSEVTLAKMSQAKIGKKVSPEVRAKMSIAQKSRRI